MPSTTPLIGAPYPNGTEQPDGPMQFKNALEHTEKFSVMRFATAAARDTAIPTPAEGMVCRVTGSGWFGYDGGAWVKLVDDASGGTLRTYTPAVTGVTTNPTLGTGATLAGRYYLTGPVVHVDIRIVLGTSPGPGSGFYMVSLPVTPNGFGVIGGQMYTATTASGRFPIAGSVEGGVINRTAIPYYASTPTYGANWGSSHLAIGSGTTPALAEGDRVQYAGIYFR